MGNGGGGGTWNLRSNAHGQGKTVSKTQHNKEIYDYKVPWTPSAEAFKKYQIREVELARVNIHVKRNPPETTLHSRFTVYRLGDSKA